MRTEFGNLVVMDESSSGPLPGKPAPPTATPAAPKPAQNRGSYKLKAISQNRNPRIHIRQDVVTDLVTLGVPDNPTDIAHAVGQITKQAIAGGTAYLPDLGDITALEAALVDRVAELTRVNAEVLKHLSELSAIGEETGHNQTIQTLTRGLT